MGSKNPGNHLEEPMELKAVYTKDSKRFHVFQLEEGQEVRGSLYFPRDGGVPGQVIITLETPGEAKDNESEKSFDGGR
jgi:hypothetical protein